MISHEKIDWLAKNLRFSWVRRTQNRLQWAGLMFTVGNTIVCNCLILPNPKLIQLASSHPLTSSKVTSMSSGVISLPIPLDQEIRTYSGLFFRPLTSSQRANAGLDSATIMIDIHDETIHSRSRGNEVPFGGGGGNVSQKVTNSSKNVTSIV